MTLGHSIDGYNRTWREKIPTGALPLEGTTETLDMLLRTALPCNPSIQLQSSGNHRESTNHLPKDHNKRKIAQRNDAVEQFMFSWRLSSHLQWKMAVLFFSHYQANCVWSLWGLTPLTLSQSWSSYGNSSVSHGNNDTTNTVTPWRKNGKQSMSVQTKS